MLPEPVEPASERVPGEIGLPTLPPLVSAHRESRRVLPLRAAPGFVGRPSLSSTVSSGRWPVLRARLTLELLASPRCAASAGRAGPERPREDTEDMDPLRMIAGCEDSVVEDAAERIFVPTEGVRLSDRAVRAEVPDLNESASVSLPARRPAGQLPSWSEPTEGKIGRAHV